MKLLTLLAILITFNSYSQDTLTLKTRYNTIVLGEQVFKVRVSLEQTGATVARPTPTPQTTTPVQAPANIAMSERPTASYVLKKDYEAKMKLIDSTILKTKTSLVDLQRSKAALDSLKSDFDKNVIKFSSKYYQLSPTGEIEPKGATP